MSMKDNQIAFIHGGEGAVRRISQGKPFLGLAADAQKAVEVELEEKGLDEIVKVNAIRLQSALNLYFGAIEKAAADGDLTAFDRYVARYGWLAGVTLRAWAQVGKMAKKDDYIDAAQIIQIYRDDMLGTSNSVLPVDSEVKDA